VTVSFATQDDTALVGEDYQAALRDVDFAPGETSKLVTVELIGDTLPETDETFFVNLSGATNAVIGVSRPWAPSRMRPRLSIGHVSATEGNYGTTELIFTVTLSGASDQPVTVAYATASGTATAGSDYQAASGTLIIPAGQTTGTITVLVNGDLDVEYDEYFLVNLTSPSGASSPPAKRWAIR
jgi:chitinase